MTDHIILIDDPKAWKPTWGDYPVVVVRDYLTHADWAGRKGLRIINLCRDMRYLALGWYGSLLAEARGHKVLPETRTLSTLSRRTLYGIDLEELDKRVQQLLRRRPAESGDRLEFRVLFGRTDIPELAGLARALFEAYAAPILRLVLRRNGLWRISSIRLGSVGGLNNRERELFFEQLAMHLGRRWRVPARRRPAQHELAILIDPDEAMPPSNRTALAHFMRAARARGLDAELITHKDYGRLAEFDALFIRETTSVNHHTYRFARKAQAEGMPVIDDPDSILRCTNKVYLAELLARHKIATPKTQIVHPDDLGALIERMGFPMVLKVPDGAFSRGVIKVNDRAELEAGVVELFRESDLVLAQAFTPTEFDWRVGVLGGKALYASKYFMSRGHWQIVDHSAKGKPREGAAETLPISQVPPAVLKTALKAARLIGDGLYGVDLKATGSGVLVIEVNDNPSIDAGVEDQILGKDLYRAIIDQFVDRLANGNP